jgi:hypothetical protein
VTVWFTGANWNCTISPFAAVIESGENARVPFAFPTLTTWTVVAVGCLLGRGLMFGEMEGLTKGAADAQGREGESCELHIGGDEKDPDLKTNEGDMK